MSTVALTSRWLGKMAFETETSGFHFIQDAKKPIGEDQGPTPKQMLLAAICGCTGMDVVSLLRKFRQPIESFHIEAQAELTQEHPMIFREVKLRYIMTGPIEIEKANESVQLSQSKYCGVSAMVAKAVPISYEILVNGNRVAEGKSNFP